MPDGFFARVDDHGWSMAPRIPGRMYPRLPIGGGLDIEFSADAPVVFKIPVEDPRPPTLVRLPRRHWWQRSRVVLRQYAPSTLAAARVGFFDSRGRLLWSSGLMGCAPGDSISVAPVATPGAPVDA